MGCSSKHVTIAPNVSHGGLSFRWGSFGLQELTRFKELLEKPIKLKLRWPNDKGSVRKKDRCSDRLGLILKEKKVRSRRKIDVWIGSV
ncbi:hypothetical protein J1N35_022336 [Gossypium stocksii]|uniref:Uncharacterized protein n=1 Tax=Gossypium stocksii TaxID=47602 RepID=A0A9D3VG95_9ROSI|nr:hypothetical protein J1N35_022336 [Gossypium stocksii]